MSIYYDYSKPLSYNPQILMVCGMRGNGKTYGAKKFVINNFFKRGEQFVYLRRNDDEMKKTKRKFLSDIKDLIGENGTMFIRGDELWFKKTQKNAIEGDNDELEENDEEGEENEKCEIVGYFASIKCHEKYKSGSYHKVTTIIYDEFMSKKGYLKDEIILFNDLFETIFRDRKKARAILISNTLSTVSPYFEFFGIKPKEKEKGIIKNTFNFGNGSKFTVICDFPESSEYKEHKKKTPSGMLAMITGYDKYSIDGEFLLDNNKNVIEKVNKSSLSFRYNIILNDLKIGVYFYNNSYYFGDPFDNGKTFCTTAEESQKYNAMFVNKDWSNFKNYKKAFKGDNMLFSSLKYKNEVVLFMRKIIKGF